MSKLKLSINERENSSRRVSRRYTGAWEGCDSNGSNSPSNSSPSLPHSASFERGKHSHSVKRESSERNTTVVNIRGHLLKKGSWTGWSEAYFVVEGGMLLEFKHESSSKPQKVLRLAECKVHLAEDITGKAHSFMIACPHTDSLFLRAYDNTQMVEWVSAIATHCADSEVKWGEDAFIEAFVDAVVVSSQDGTIVSVNHKTCELLGYTKNELMGKNVSVLVPMTIRSKHDDYLERYNKTGDKRLIGKPRSLEACKSDGTVIRVVLSLGEHTESDTGVKQYIATLREEKPLVEMDVTARVNSAVDNSLAEFGKSLKTVLEKEMKDMQDLLEQYKTQAELLKTKVALAEKRGGRLGREDSFLKINTEDIHINEKLANAGGSGATVYSCTVNGWQCAMKELITPATSPALQSFEAEISMLESLPSHPNLVRYLFHQQTATSLRLFMQRYPGTLGAHIYRQREQKKDDSPQSPGSRTAGLGHYSLKQVIKFSVDIIKGIEVLHSLHIIHRDIKSDNIFYSLDASSEIGGLAIGDLDTAKIMNSLGHTATTVGTPCYMAPEVMNSNTGSYTYSADVWSFAMVLYEIMMLEKPYAASNMFKVATLVSTGTPPALSDEVKELYEEIIPMWQQCVSVVPEERPSITKLKGFFSSLL